MGNLLVAQSGGPTAAINASLAGVITMAKQNINIEIVYGSRYGINGVLNDNLVVLNELTDYELSLLEKTPGAYLGSARHLLSKVYDEEYEKILETVKKHNISYICFIGGNDSMDTVSKLSAYFESISYPCNVIGVPKTVDNDLVLTDHCPGFGSAGKYVASTLSEIKLDTAVYEKGRVTIVEIMGRDAGWLTACSKLPSIIGLGPDLIYMPEVAFDLDTFLNDVDALYKKNKKVLVAISEGIRDKDGNYMMALSTASKADGFGHTQLGGAAANLCEIVKERLGYNTRAVELSLPQRCAGHMVSKTDIDEAKRCGEFAVMSAIDNTAKFVCMIRDDSKKYSIHLELKNIHEVANKVKPFPKEWIINGNDISEEFINYAAPLIEGEVELEYKLGVPNYLRIK